MTDELQIDIRLEDEPDVVYPDSDQDGKAVAIDHQAHDHLLAVGTLAADPAHRAA